MHHISAVAGAVLIDGTPYAKNSFAVSYSGAMVTLRHWYDAHNPVLCNTPFDQIINENAGGVPFGSLADLQAYIVANLFQVPGSGGGGGGTGDATEATQMLVRAAVQGIDANCNQENTQVAIKDNLDIVNNSLGQISSAIGTVINLLGETVSRHNTKLTIIPVTPGLITNTLYTIGGYDSVLKSFVYDPALVDGLLDHEKIHFADREGKYSTMAHNILSTPHSVIPHFTGYLIQAF